MPENVARRGVADFPTALEDETAVGKVDIDGCLGAMIGFGVESRDRRAAAAAVCRA